MPYIFPILFSLISRHDQRFNDIKNIGNPSFHFCRRAVPIIDHVLEIMKNEVIADFPALQQILAV